MIHAVHAKVGTEMDAGGAHLDAIYFCPHHPTVGEPPYRQECDCRKPRPGLLHRFVVGDRFGDLELAWSVGATGVLVRTGYGRGEIEHHASAWPRQPDMVAEHLLEAVITILAGAEDEG
jgi:D-glycero-D-manno-heptose 1,7-bisphosphate phosphatase